MSELEDIVHRINDAWRHGRFEELRDYFHPEVIVAQPGFARRTAGRDSLIASYAEFARHATIHSFTTGEIHVDEAAGSAVTTMPWTMDYTYDGERIEERGWDLLVFGKREGRWVVVWRTVVVER